MLAGGETTRDAVDAPRVRDDRVAVAIGLLLIVLAAIAWIGVLREAASMDAMPMDGMGMSRTGLGEPGRFVFAWGVMMAAMMLPSAAPMIALYAAIQRNSAKTGQRGVSTALFALTYLLVWTLFGTPVYVAGSLWEMAASMRPAVAIAEPYLVAAALLAAGAYQLTPLKDVCLRACRSPLGFLLSRWRGGYRGSLKLGLAHAGYCVGCCWALMVVLVVAGSMGLHWVLLIAAIVFAEKLLPRGRWTAYAVGGVLLALGATLLVMPDLVPALRMEGM